MRQLKYDIKKTKNRHSNQTDKQKYIFFIFLKKASAIISLNKINQKKLNIFLNKKTFFVPERSI